jgi:peptide/nickel transport system permease protein
VRGDFGYSTSNSESTAAAIMERVPATLELMLTAIGVSLILGVVLGVFSAANKYTIWDYVLTTLAFAGQSLPVFWFALMMQLAFSVYGFTCCGYHIALPSAGISSSDTFDWGDRIEHLILPCSCATDSATR